MKFILKLILLAGVVLLAAYFIPAIKVEDNSFLTALLVVFVITVLNVVVKPILIILTIPVTILTLGLFLFVINALIILLADYLIDGFYIDNFLWTLIFSFILSLANYLIGAIVDKK